MVVIGAAWCPKSEPVEGSLYKLAASSVGEDRANATRFARARSPRPRAAENHATHRLGMTFSESETDVPSPSPA
jgi:hypothetical protein